ncbi:uncharacterized protein Rgk2 isoform X2 [Prorops nasuta]|uniref:uncharacterized protein Rgk2 isoform X2 n=1 Tax=Prorops nasuta TaxID=863751 RepID=UPI0034CD75C5
MATSSPGHSIHIKSPRSPRQLPQLPISGRRSPSQLSVTKTPTTPRVFEFPPEFYPETPNMNFDFDKFEWKTDLNHRPASRSPSYNYSGNKSPKSPLPEMLLSPNRNLPIFQFCERRSLGKTLSYPPKGPVAPLELKTSRSSSSTCFGQKSPKPMDRHRNSAFGFCGVKSPMSPTIVTSNHCSISPQTPLLESEHRKSPEGKDIYRKSKVSSLEGSFRLDEHPKGGESRPKIRGSFNKSQGCLYENSRERRRGSDEGSANARNDKFMARKSTSDLTEIEDVETEVTLLSSPRRRGSMKGGLAYLASRRSSRDSQRSNLSNVSNEDIGPLNFSAHPRGRQRRTSNFLELPVPDHIKPRVHSLPEKAYNPRAGDDLYRLRAFSITHKGVVNRGDSIISRHSRSNTSVNSSRNSNVSGERSPFEGSCCSGHGGAVNSTDSEIEEVSKYRVVLLGDSGVGKTALVSQFMTSEYMNTYDASLDDEFGEKTVSILLDGEESEMIFIDHPHVEMSVENSLSTYEPHACIVVYSIVSRASFQVAEEILNYLWREHHTQERSVIVVGNKSDLARSRIISANEGKQLATSRECKFIETSSGIQHNVDELLVGVLKQIRLRESRDKKQRRQGSSKGKILPKLHGSKTVLSLSLAREILQKICLNDSKSKSCENLHVL